MFNYDLTLRKVERNDLKKLFSLKCDAMFNHHRTVILNTADQERWFDAIDQNVHFPSCVYLMGMHMDIDVGVFALSNINYINRTGDVSCDIFPQFRSQGFGTKILSSGILFLIHI